MCFYAHLTIASGTPKVPPNIFKHLKIFQFYSFNVFDNIRRNETIKYLVLPESALTYNPGCQPELQLVGIYGPL